LAKALAHELDAGWLQLDSIWLAMKVAAGEGTPMRDVLDIDRRMRGEDEADDDVLAAQADVEAALIPRRRGLPLEDRHRLMNRRIFQYGAWLANEARAYQLPVVEALPFKSLLQRARAALLSR
jgi:hypothetical protein